MHLLKILSSNHLNFLKAFLLQRNNFEHQSQTESKSFKNRTNKPYLLSYYNISHIILYKPIGETDF